VHPAVYRTFERVCAERGAGGDVLEIGAVPSKASLLNMRALAGAASKTGLNLDGPHCFGDYEIVQGNANDMACFEDGAFDTVLCNAVLEHDPFFWKTLGEIRRVTKSGGLVVIGAPGYRELWKDRLIRSQGEGGGARGGRESWLNALGRRLSAWRLFDLLINVTPTFRVHNEPGDYYRFSPQAFRDVFFAGMRDARVRSVLIPPRLIGSGFKVWLCLIGTHRAVGPSAVLVGRAGVLCLDCSRCRCDACLGARGMQLQRDQLDEIRQLGEYEAAVRSM
jgi:SAM-dependent methyltransferase